METSIYNQNGIDNMIALELMGYSYRLILTYQTLYIETKYDFYLKNIKEIKSSLERFNNSEQSAINRYRLNIITKCDEVIAEIESLWWTYKNLPKESA